MFAGFSAFMLSKMGIYFSLFVKNAFTKFYIIFSGKNVALWKFLRKVQMFLSQKKSKKSRCDLRSSSAELSFQKFKKILPHPLYR